MTHVVSHCKIIVLHFSLFNYMKKKILKLHLSSNYMVLWVIQLLQLRRRKKSLRFARARFQKSQQKVTTFQWRCN